MKASASPTHCRLPLAFLATCLVLQACSTKSSSTGDHGDPIPTQSMYLNARVEAKDDHTAVISVRVTDAHVHSTQYRLDGGDYFRACVAAQCRNLVDDYSQLGTYLPFFPLGYANKLGFIASTDYVISFSRPDARDAPDSRVSLPAAFNIDTPTQGEQVTDGDVVLVSWSPAGAGNRVEVRTEADCQLANGQHQSADGILYADSDGDGSEHIFIDDIIDRVRARHFPWSIYRCDVDIEVTHERNGVVDPAFHGGSVIGVVTRKVTVDYVPR